jgi:hypothetical protein
MLAGPLSTLQKAATDSAVSWADRLGALEIEIQICKLPEPERRLAADVEVTAARMHGDEEATMAALSARRALVDELIARHRRHIAMRPTRKLTDRLPYPNIWENQFGCGRASKIPGQSWMELRSRRDWLYVCRSTIWRWAHDSPRPQASRLENVPETASFEQLNIKLGVD